MNSKLAFAAGVLGAIVLSSSALADAASLKSATSSCLTKHANTRESASVTLECTAGGGKLGACKVVDNSGSKGFADAAVCVAGHLPIGDKTGAIRVPVRFPGGA
jgi:hypothetical protein